MQILIYNPETNTKKTSTTTILRLMRLVLEKNNFQFNGVNYQQIARTAMGTRMAPQFANLYMAQFEERYFYPYKPDLEKHWFRFIGVNIPFLKLGHI